MRILACADIHMGRKSDLASSGHAAWDAIVQKAIELQVDVLLLVGDVVEQEKAWLSVYGPLLAGLSRLKEEGIEVIGVGGNHDWSVFPRLASESDAITILGLNGSWQAHDVGFIRFLGWSFPRRHVDYSPLDSFDSSLFDPSRLTLGLLHGDFGQSLSSYAPIDAISLTKTGVPLWMLGHIHTPGKVAGAEAYYCGSSYALDVQEKGAHGLYLLETVGEHFWKEPTFIPLCPYRYERYTVDVSGLTDVEHVRSAITRTAREFVEHLSFSGTVVLTPVFRGKLHASLDLFQVFPSERGLYEELFPSGERGKVLLSNRLEDETETEVDLLQLAKGSGPEALLATMLSDEKTLQEMGRQYQALEEESYNTTGFNLLQKQSLTQKEAQLEARYAGIRLLRSMLSQRRESDGE